MRRVRVFSLEGWTLMSALDTWLKTLTPAT